MIDFALSLMALRRGELFNCICGKLFQQVEIYNNNAFILYQTYIFVFCIYPINYLNFYCFIEYFRRVIISPHKWDF